MSPKGKTSLVFEYPYQPGDETERMSDDRLIEITINDLITHFSPTTKKSEIARGMVFSVPKAYPKYDLGYQQPLKKIKQYLAKNHPLIQIIGRGGRFRYNNMDHSILTGLLAARNILAGKQVYDLDNVNNEAEYLEEKKVK
jgi:protoporphyrinogen oxidase